MYEPEGSWSSRFEPLVQRFAEQLASGAELGGSLAVMREGDAVVDVWGGWSNAAKTVEWHRDTIVNVWSVTKVASAFALLTLVRRDDIRLNDTVGSIWPEFAATGKSEITLREVLAHRSGVSGWEAPCSVDLLFDHRAAADRLAAQEPWWTPGSASGYHIMTFGHLIGELVRRVTGMSLGRYFATEIAGPLGADYLIGGADSQADRIAELVPPERPPRDLRALDADSVAVRSFTGPSVHARITQTAAWQRAEIGAANGHANARSIAQVQDAICRPDSSLISRDVLSDALTPNGDPQTDLVLGADLCFAGGHALGVPPGVRPSARRTCYWVGYGGALVLHDFDSGYTLGYAMNKMGPGLLGSARTVEYAELFLAATDGSASAGRPTT